MASAKGEESPDAIVRLRRTIKRAVANGNGEQSHGKRNRKYTAPYFIRSKVEIVR